MSDRDRQRQHDRTNNMSSSMHDRVHSGDSDFDGRSDITGGAAFGSLNNPDEQTLDSYSFMHTVLFYILAIGLSVAYSFFGLWIFEHYLDNSLMYETIPSLILFVVSLLLGFLSSKVILVFIKALRK
ncbi:hypothetical protein [Marinilactibacillus piezotolerans]|uniref:hypothetical protein n=1 Tax=Marinilactibacillus piezotolerans TaxID=258723 RepID=UPI0009AFFB2B|nr:hypothetical protein [Marinilactibacillus piezotolerans]